MRKLIALAARYEHARLLRLAQENDMTDMLRHEYARDAANQRLIALKNAESEAYFAVLEALRKLQAVSGASDEDRVHAGECVWDTITDMTYDARMEIEDEIAAHEEAIDLAEEADQQRSSPVVL